MEKKKLNRSGNRRGLSLNSHKNIYKALETLKGNNHAKKELSITRIQREMLDKPCPYAPDRTWAEYLAERGMAMAAENATYYKELLDRLEGKVTQPIGGDEDKPIRHLVEVIDQRTKEELTRFLNE